MPFEMEYNFTLFYNDFIHFQINYFQIKTKPALNIYRMMQNTLRKRLVSFGSLRYAFS